MTKVALFVVVAASVASGCKERDAPRGTPASHVVPRESSHVRIIGMLPAGDVREAVLGQIIEASGVNAGEQRRVVVYVGAAWCEPCRRFHEAAARGDLDGIFPGLTLLEFDLDRDRERLNAAGYASKYIPLFALPGPDGSASGKQVEGGVKGEGAVAFMTPRLEALLRQ